MIGTIYLTLPICLLQQAMIDNLKTMYTILPIIELEEEEKQIVFVKAKNPFMKLSHNLRQLLW